MESSLFASQAYWPSRTLNNVTSRSLWPLSGTDHTPRYIHYNASQKIFITGWFGGAEALTQRVARAMSHAVARWQSGYAAVCKTVYIGSIPVRASNTLYHDPVHRADWLLHRMSRGMKTAASTGFQATLSCRNRLRYRLSHLYAHGTAARHPIGGRHISGVVNGNGYPSRGFGRPV